MKSLKLNIQEKVKYVLMLCMQKTEDEKRPKNIFKA